MELVEKFREWFYYDETSPSWLRWAKECSSGRDHKISIKNKGDIVGRKV